MSSQRIPDPVAYAREQCGVLVAEALALRPVVLPREGSPPADYVATLLVARGRLDRVETVFLQAQALAGRLSREATQLKDDADDAWDKVADQSRHTARSGNDYEGAKERYASFNLAVFTHTRTARQWRNAAAIAADAERRVQVLYWGLKDTRQELIEILRSFTLESNLDR